MYGELNINVVFIIVIEEISSILGYICLSEFQSVTILNRKGTWF